MSFDCEISEWKQIQNLKEEKRRMQEKITASFESGFQEGFNAGFKVGYEKRKFEETAESEDK